MAASGLLRPRGAPLDARTSPRALEGRGFWGQSVTEREEGLSHQGRLLGAAAAAVSRRDEAALGLLDGSGVGEPDLPAPPRAAPLLLLSQ